MTRALLIFMGAFAAILMSFTALALVPSLQLAAIEPTEGTRNYTFEERMGKQIYMRDGCMYCHTQQVRPDGFGSDMDRGWGPRGSLPGDYVYDDTHQLGTMRTGPDLHDIATRQPSRDWQLAHLYQPRSVSPGSVMPAYPYLFEVKNEDEVLASEVTVPIGGEYAPPEGQVVVATEEALWLYEYLMTLELREQEE
ncbi:MAG: cbb3-type cytochrome c oxidase subunit II [Longimonas sp.]|uniref:cbb3-type cytochrome c oxidase subunit II n=1 Tax=Longimonas sp. TaxID=2039626 RepID=UPI003350933C